MCSRVCIYMLLTLLFLYCVLWAHVKSKCLINTLTLYEMHMVAFMHLGQRHTICFSKEINLGEGVVLYLTSSQHLHKIAVSIEIVQGTL